MKLDKIELAQIKLPNFNRENINTGTDHIEYGDDNKFPQDLLFLSNNSVTHAACLNLKTNALGGLGFETTSSKAKAFLDSFDFETDGSTILQKVAASMAIFEGFSIEVVWNKKGDKIASIQFIDFEKLRACKPDPEDRSGRVKFYKYNNDWVNYPTKYTILAAFDPALSKDFPNQILYAYNYNPISKFYPVPRYTSAINYVYNEFELGKHHLSATINSFLPSALITFIGNPSPDERDRNSKLFLKHNTGSENTSKLIINYAEDATYKPQIDVIANNNAVDYHINSEQTSKQKIVTAHNIVSPALIADSDSNTSLFSNGEELKAIWDVFYSTYIQKQQTLIEKNFNIILKYAGFKNESFKIIPFTLIPTAQNSESIDTAPTEPTQETEQNIEE
jgi:hypothetical protein